MKNDQRIKKTKKEKIVEKHMEALLAELIKSGEDAMGVAGGVLLGGEDCHVFFLVKGDIVPAHSGGFNGNDFVKDIAQTMLLSTQASPEKEGA